METSHNLWSVVNKIGALTTMRIFDWCECDWRTLANYSIESTLLDGNGCEFDEQALIAKLEDNSQVELIRQINPTD